MSQPKAFVTMGPMTDPERQIYIERPEDRDLLKCIRREDYVTILGARQTGKTSLLYMLKRELKTEIPIFVDLAGFSGVKPEHWYDRVAKTIVRRFPEPRERLITTQTFCSDHEEFRNLLWKIADASAGTDRLVLLIDEIGGVPREIRDNFFGAIRSIYTERGLDSAFQKYIFVLAGATPLWTLISPESDNSPFNVSRLIYMSDFDREGVEKLAQNLASYHIAIDEDAINQIYNLTHGHPSLTQEVFARLLQANPQRATVKMVNNLVDELVEKGCNNLNHVLRWTQDESISQQVLAILNRKVEIPFNLLDPDVLHLYLIGVIGKGSKGECVIRNHIYARVLRFIAKEEEAEQTLKEDADGIQNFIRNETIESLLEKGYIYATQRQNSDEPKYALTDKGKEFIQGAAIR
jgi:predicted transcriptional regulator